MFCSPGCCNPISQWEKLTFLLMTSCSPTSMGAVSFTRLIVSYTVRCRLWLCQLIERSHSLATWSNSVPETPAAISPFRIHHLEVVIFLCTSGSLGEETHCASLSQPEPQLVRERRMTPFWRGVSLRPVGASCRDNSECITMLCRKNRCFLTTAAE
uniref:Liver-expressed antimicrobial peptide 2 n=2 Tax=Neognathae TaxID=8825 RepID=A0A8V5GG75_MELUD